MGYEVAECLVIEDSISGIQAAVAGGFDVYAYVNSKRDQLEELATKVFLDMPSLQQMLI